MKQVFFVPMKFGLCFEGGGGGGARKVEKPKFLAPNFFKHLSV